MDGLKIADQISKLLEKKKAHRDSKESGESQPEPHKENIGHEGKNFCSSCGSKLKDPSSSES